MKLSVLLLSVFFCAVSWGQKLGNLSPEWQLVAEQNEINFYAKVEPCAMSATTPQPFDIAFLKIENKSNSEKTVSYNFVMKFAEGCNGCNDELETFFMQTIPANSSLEEDCRFQQKGMSYVVLNRNFKGSWKFENLSITNIKVN